MADDLKPWERPDWDDSPEWTKDDFQRARPAREVLPPEIVAQLVRATPAPEARKQSVGLRLSPELVEAMRATGRGWQSRAEDVLRAAFLEKTNHA